MNLNQHYTYIKRLSVLSLTVTVLTIKNISFLVYLMFYKTIKNLFFVEVVLLSEKRENRRTTDRVTFLQTRNFFVTFSFIPKMLPNLKKFQKV